MQESGSTHLDWITEQVTMLAAVLREGVTPAVLAVYAAEISDIPRAQLEGTFAKARRECVFFPRIAELRALAGVGQQQRASAEANEALAAWIEVQRFCAKYVGNDPYGNWGPQHGWYKSWPDLGPRVIDSVRAVGGWRAIKLADDRELTFLQKRFTEAFSHCHAVQGTLGAAASGTDSRTLPPAESPDRAPANLPSTANDR